MHPLAQYKFWKAINLMLTRIVASEDKQSIETRSVGQKHRYQEFRSPVKHLVGGLTYSGSGSPQKLPLKVKVWLEHFSGKLDALV